MSQFSDQAMVDFNKLCTLAGNQVRFRYFSYSPTSTGSGYDDEVTLTRSGVDIYVSGVVQPILSPKGTDEAMLMEQGRVLFGDNRLYVPGTINTSGIWKVGIGSPTGQEFGITDAGQNAWTLNGSMVYKKVYVRFLPTGSLIGE